MPNAPRTFGQKYGKNQPRRDADKAYNEKRKNDPTEKPIHTARWQKVRLIKLTQDPLCQECIKQGHTRAAQQVHHVIPRAIRPDLTFVMENLMSVCVPCHNRIEKGKDA